MMLLYLNRLVRDLWIRYTPDEILKLQECDASDSGISLYIGGLHHLLRIFRLDNVIQD